MFLKPRENKKTKNGKGNKKQKMEKDFSQSDETFFYKVHTYREIRRDFSKVRFFLIMFFLLY